MIINLQESVKRNFFLFTLVSIIAFACKLKAPVTPNEIRLPASFQGSSDSTNIGNIARKDFFPDSNLIRLIDTALHNNFDLKKAIQRMEFASADVRLSNGRFFPVIAPEISTRVDRYGRYTMNGVGNFDTNLSPNIKEDKKIPDPTPDFFLGLRSSWEIGVWGKFRNNKKSAVARFLASEKGKQVVLTNLVAQVAEAYYNLLKLDNELLTIQNNIKLQNKALEITTVMKEGARANELGVKQFTAQLLNTEALEIDIIQRIQLEENRINFLLGRLPQPILRGQPIREQILPSKISAGIPSMLLTQRPDIAQAEMDLVASKADLKVARASFYPSLTLTAYTGLNAFKSAFLFTTPESIAWGALAGLTSPLFNQFALKSNYKRATAQQLSSFYAYQQTVLNAFYEVNASLIGINNFQRIYEKKQMETETLHKAVEVSNDLFMAGQANYMEVILAQKNLLQAELELSIVRKDQFVALIELYRALGGGWK